MHPIMYIFYLYIDDRHLSATLGASVLRAPRRRTIAARPPLRHAAQLTVRGGPRGSLDADAALGGRCGDTGAVPGLPSPTAARGTGRPRPTSPAAIAARTKTWSAAPAAAPDPDSSRLWPRTAGGARISARRGALGVADRNRGRKRPVQGVRCPPGPHRLCLDAGAERDVARSGCGAEAPQAGWALHKSRVLDVWQLRGGSQGRRGAGLQSPFGGKTFPIHSQPPSPRPATHRQGQRPSRGLGSLPLPVVVPQSADSGQQRTERTEAVSGQQPSARSG